MGYADGDSRNVTKESEINFLSQFSYLEDNRYIDMYIPVHELVTKYNMSIEDAESAIDFILSHYSPLFRSKEEAKMKPFFDDLNERGKLVAIERVKELSEIPQYQKQPSED